MKRSAHARRHKLVVPVVGLLLVAPGCSFLLDDNANPVGTVDGGEIDGASASDGSSADANAADASMNVDDYRLPYICDNDTIALYHFDMPSTLADECNNNGFPAGSGIRSEPGPPGFMSAAAPQGGNAPTASLSANAVTFSVDAWILPDAQAGRVLRVGDASFASDTLYIDVVGNGGQVDLMVQSPSTTSGFVFPAPLDTWTHVRAVWDGSLLSVYRNGVCVGTSVGGLLPMVDLSSLRILQDQNHQLDEVRISSSARNPPGEVCPPP